MPIELRPYQTAIQQSLRSELREHRRIVVVAPTGAGKGLVIAWMAAEAAARRRRVLIAVHRAELVLQTHLALAEQGVSAGIISAKHAETPGVPVQVAMVPTLARPQRIARWADWDPDLLIIDECHHLMAKSWQRLIEVFPQAFTIGFTATPMRLDGKGLGRVFRGMVVAATTRQLIAAGFLSRVQHFAPAIGPDRSSIEAGPGGDFAAESAAAAMSGGRLVGDAIDHWRRHLQGHGPCLAYGCTIAHSRELAARFCAAGAKAAHVDGDTSSADREAAVAALASGELDILFNVGLFTEGLDVPALAGVMLLRPTKSLGLYLQMCGRALRTAPGKNRAVILDHAGNCFVHGLCDEDREWSLDDRARRNRKNPADAPVRRCGKCGGVVAISCRKCAYCGAELMREATPPEVAPGRLEIPDREEMLRLRLEMLPLFQQRRWAGDDYEKLKLIAELRGFRPGWAWYEHQRAAAEAENRSAR